VGLTQEQVASSRRTFGANDVPPPEVESFWEKFFENFEDPMIKILSVALVITLALAALGYASWTEGLGIGLSVFIATFVSTYSEHKNEASFQELQQKSTKITVNVLRETPETYRAASSVAGACKNGLITTVPDRYAPAPVAVPIEEIVLGDRILLQAGDRVPADGILIAGRLTVDQSILTGEKAPLKRTPHPAFADEESAASFVPPSSSAGAASDEALRTRLCPLPAISPETAKDLSCSYRVFRGSVVDDGEGVFVVDAVGVNTVFGALAKDLSIQDKRAKPLQIKLANLADLIATLANYGAIIILISFLFKQFVMDNNYSWTKMVEYASNWHVCLHDLVTSVMLAIIIIVVAVPEGLPMMIAIVLSLNMRALLAENVLVRRLLGIETAGSLNVLFVDKTGTLTEGVFQPDRFITGDFTSFSTWASIPGAFKKLVAFVLRESAGTASVDLESRSIVGGNATDRAVLRYLYPIQSSNSNKVSGNTKDEEPETLHGAKIENEIIFSSTRKFSATQLSLPKSSLSSSSLAGLEIDFFTFDGDRVSTTLVKGAPERVIAQCNSYYAPTPSAAGAASSSSKDSVTKLPLSDAQRREIMERINKLSSEGARIIALATSSAPLPDKDAIEEKVAASNESKAPEKKVVEKKEKKEKEKENDDADGSESEYDAEAEAALVERMEEELVRAEQSAQHLLPKNMTLVGILSVTDSVRPNSRPAVIAAHKAGIQVVMITGDRVETAVAVAKECALLSPGFQLVDVPPMIGDAEVDASKLRAWIREQQEVVITSAQLHLLTTQDVAELLPRLRIVARALPSDKSKLVSITQTSHTIVDENGNPVHGIYHVHGLPSSASSDTAPLLSHRGGSSDEADSSSSESDSVAVKRGSGSAIALSSLKSKSSSSVTSFDSYQTSTPRPPGAVCVVGMTGDGVNDSAALKKADVSFSMGSGSEVAKEASDIVILDDNFQSIIQSVLYGRTIFKSIRKFIVFQCTMNLGTTVIVCAGPFLGFDFPLTLVQLLWVNLIMDTFAALAFGGEPALERYLLERPVRREAPIVNRAMLRAIVFGGLYIAITSIIFLTWDPIQAFFSRPVGEDVVPAALSQAHADSAAHESHKELVEQGGLVFLTAFFSYFVLVCTINAFNVRTHLTDLRANLSRNRGFMIIIPMILIMQVLFTEIRPLATVLRTVPLTWTEWLGVFACAALIIPFDLARKKLFPSAEDDGDHDDDDDASKVADASAPRHSRD